MRHRHLLWDWNGTLMDDLHLCVEIINGQLTRHGKPALDAHGYRERFDFPIRLYYERLGFPPSGPTFEEVAHGFIRDYDLRRTECGLHHGVHETLAAVAASGRTQSVLSAYRQHTLVEIVGHYGLAAHFTRLDGHSDIYAESKVANGRRVAAEIGADPASLLLIGDTAHDHEVAHEIGADCVLLSHGHHPPGKLRATGRPVLENLSHLRHWLGLERPA